MREVFLPQHPGVRGKGRGRAPVLPDDDVGGDEVPVAELGVVLHPVQPLQQLILRARVKFLHGLDHRSHLASCVLKAGGPAPADFKLNVHQPANGKVTAVRGQIAQYGAPLTDGSRCTDKPSAGLDVAFIQCR